MAEINEAARIITGHLDPEARVIFGAVIDDKLRKEKSKLPLLPRDSIMVIGSDSTNGFLVWRITLRLGQNLFDTIKTLRQRLVSHAVRQIRHRRSKNLLMIR